MMHRIVRVKFNDLIKRYREASTYLFDHPEIDYMLVHGRNADVCAFLPPTVANFKKVIDFIDNPDGDVSTEHYKDWGLSAMPYRTVKHWTPFFERKGVLFCNHKNNNHDVATIMVSFSLLEHFGYGLPGDHVEYEILSDKDLQEYSLSERKLNEIASRAAIHSDEAVAADRFLPADPAVHPEAVAGEVLVDDEFMVGDLGVNGCIAADPVVVEGLAGLLNAIAGCGLSLSDALPHLKESVERDGVYIPDSKSGDAPNPA